METYKKKGAGTQDRIENKGSKVGKSSRGLGMLTYIYERILLP